MPDLPLSGRRLLLTRAQEGSSDVRGALERLGAEVCELPTIAIEPPTSWEQLDAILRDLSVYQWIAFASRNAVRAVIHRLAVAGARRNLAPIFPASVRIAAVGPSTAEVLASAGVTVACTAPEATGAGLARALRDRGIQGLRILLPVGNLARPELRIGLNEAGARVDEIVVYRTVRPAITDRSLLKQVADRKFDTVVLGSPSALHNLVGMLGGDPDALAGSSLACMGPTTAAAVRALGLETTTVAHPSTLNGLVQSIVDAVRKEKTGK